MAHSFWWASGSAVEFRPLVPEVLGSIACLVYVSSHELSYNFSEASLMYENMKSGMISKIMLQFHQKY